MFVSHALLIIWAPWGNILPMFVQNGEYMFKSTRNHITFHYVGRKKPLELDICKNADT